MTKIENFITKVEDEVFVALQSGFLPDPDRERPALERLCKKYPELNINPIKERKILIHTRILMNGLNN